MANQLENCDASKFSPDYRLTVLAVYYSQASRSRPRPIGILGHVVNHLSEHDSGFQHQLMLRPGVIFEK